jgi:hypothetical protein
MTKVRPVGLTRMVGHGGVLSSMPMDSVMARLMTFGHLRLAEKP